MTKTVQSSNGDEDNTGIDGSWIERSPRQSSRGSFKLSRRSFREGYVWSDNRPRFSRPGPVVTLDVVMSSKVRYHCVREQHLPPLSPSDEPLSSEILRNIQFRDIKVIAALSLWCGWNVHKSKLFHLVAKTARRWRSRRTPTSTSRCSAPRSARSFATVTSVSQRPCCDGRGDHRHLQGGQVARHTSSEVGRRSQAGLQREGIAAPFAPTTAEKYPVPNLPRLRALSVDRTEHRIVKVEPWSAHSRTARRVVTETYPSKAVMERTWSDGSRTTPASGRVARTPTRVPQSTARHFAAHRRGAGKEPQAPSDGVDPTWTPQKRARVASLRTEIDGALDAAHVSGHRLHRR